jgi:hypothetical protein
MAQNNILHTIRQLFAMAEHEASNEHEAANALEKAQALLLKHNLTRAEIKTEDPQSTTANIGQVEIRSDTGYSWRRLLLNTIAKNNLCSCVGQPHKKVVNLFGNQDNVRSVLEMYYWILEQLPKMANKAFKDYEGYEGRRKFNSGFYRGAIGTISDRLRKPMADFTAGSGRELVLASDALVKAAVHKVFPQLRTSRQRATIGDGYYHGQQAGHNVQFGRTQSLSPGRRALTN